MTFLKYNPKNFFFPAEFFTFFSHLPEKTIVLAILERILYILNVSLEKVPVRNH